MSYSNRNAVMNLCRGYLDMRRDFFEVDYTDKHNRKEDVARLYRTRCRRNLKYMMTVLQSVNKLTNYFFCTDRVHCPVALIRPLSGVFTVSDDLDTKVMAEVFMKRLLRTTGPHMFRPSASYNESLYQYKKLKSHR